MKKKYFFPVGPLTVGVEGPVDPMSVEEEYRWQCYRTGYGQLDQCYNSGTQLIRTKGYPT